MAIILGSCGCGCGGGGCEPVTSNCNFVLRKYVLSEFSGISWTGEATDEEKECFNSPFGCSNISFTVLFSACTGEGEIHRNGGGGGGGGLMVCSVVTDEGPVVYTVPCCASGDTDIACGSLIYNFYDEGNGSGELFNGDITVNGVIYTISAGVITTSSGDAVIVPEDSVVLMDSTSSDVTVSQASSETLIGTFTAPYTDESIDFDNIGEIELTDDENFSSNPPCKFSYNFSFTPEDGADYYVMALPCETTQGYATVSLEQDGRAYFLANYNETTKLCSIAQTQIVNSTDTTVPDTTVPDTNAPESQ